jgi:glutaminase
MINAGAIMIASMLFPDLVISDRFDAVMDIWQKLIGTSPEDGHAAKPSFANSMYLSEAATADRNRCLAYMMKEEKAFMESANLEEALNLYFMICSIECSTSMMSKLAATFANGGVNPLTGQRVFSQAHVKNCLSLMGTCGMYDYSGEFAFQMGFPAKSGVGGAIIIVIPGVMGICTFSPRLDSVGNSVRGVAFCNALSQKFAFHNFDSLLTGKKKESGKTFWSIQGSVDYKLTLGCCRQQ